MGRRFDRAFFVAVSLVGLSASAGWNAVKLTGTTVDAEAYPNGRVVIATSNGAQEFVDGSPTAATKAKVGTGTMVEGFGSATGCVATFESNGTINWLADPACGTTVNHSVFTIATPSARRLRHTSAFGAYAAAYSSADLASQFRYSPSGGKTNDWVNLQNLLGSSFIANKAMSVLRVGATDYALIGLQGTDNMVSVTGDTAATPLVTGIGGPDELALFGGPPFGALAVSSTGTVQRIADLSVSPVAATTVALPAGSVIEGAALSLGNGDAASGDGFGFLVGAVSGTPAIFSAVPDPANPGVSWVASTAAPTGLPAAPTRVTCFGAETCVAITGTADTSGNNAFIYRNAAAPVTTLLTPEPTIDEGGSATVSVDASDADGDALYLRWTPDAADAPVTFTLSPDKKTATFSTQAGSGKVCGATPVPFGFTFSAGDGLAGHVGTSAVRVNVRHTSLPETPSVDRNAVTISSLLGAETVVASRGVAGCTPDAYEWRLTSGPALGLELSPDGATARFTPQLTACDATSTSSTYTVFARDSAGTSAVGTPVTVNVQASALPAGIASFSTATLEASCGAGAKGTVRAIPGPDQCPTSQLHWEQLSGPLLEQPTQGPGDLEVATQEKGLDALIGETLQFQVTATGGTGNVATATTALQIVPASPFVEVRHLTDTPIATESGLVGVAVELTNTTDCPLSAASYRESLEGLDFVPGSARLAGTKVDAVVDGDALVVSGLPLGAHETVRLGYYARPRLLSSPKPSGQVFVRSVPVSATAGLTSESSRCGCSGAGEGSALAAIGLLGALLRRRRQRP